MAHFIPHLGAWKTTCGLSLFASLISVVSDGFEAQLFFRFFVPSPSTTSRFRTYGPETVKWTPFFPLHFQNQLHTLILLWLVNQIITKGWQPTCPAFFWLMLNYLLRKTPALLLLLPTLGVHTFSYPLAFSWLHVPGGPRWFLLLHVHTSTAQHPPANLPKFNWAFRSHC